MKRKFKDAGSLTLFVFLGLVLALMVNYLGIRHYKRWDLTKSKIYSLTDQTLNVLKGLEKDVELYVLFSPMDAMYDQVNELMGRYRAASDRLKVEFLDPERSLVRAKELVEKYGISESNVIVVTAGESKKFIYQSDLAEMDYSGIQMGRPPTIKAFKGEEAITSAILSVTEELRMTIGFLTGHGEKGVDDYSGRGVSQLKAQLEKENYQVKTITLLGKESVEEEISVLVIAEPRTAFMSQEIDVLRGYLEEGGRLLILSDPVFSQSGAEIITLGFEPLLLEYGVKFQEEIVLDTGRMLPFVGAETIFVDTYRAHPITDKMQKVPVIFPLMRGVKTVSTAKNLKKTVLMTTTEEGWGETNLELLLSKGQAEMDEKDQQGPITLAVAVEAEEKEGSAEPWEENEEAGSNTEQEASLSEEESGDRVRIVAVGDSDFMTNDHVTNLGNATFAVNLFHWLSERETLISIPPKTPEQAQLRLNQQQLNRIFIIVGLVMPALGILLGIIVWRVRRK